MGFPKILADTSDLDGFETRLEFAVNLGRTIHGPISRYRYRKKLPRFYNRDVFPGAWDPSGLRTWDPSGLRTWDPSGLRTLKGSTPKNRYLEKNRYYDDSTTIYADLTYLFFNKPLPKGSSTPNEVDYPEFTPKSYLFEGLQDVSIIFQQKNNHITLHNCVNVVLTCHPISGLDVIGCTDVYLTIREISYLNIEDSDHIVIHGKLNPSSLFHIARSTRIFRDKKELKIGYDFDFHIFPTGLEKCRLSPVHLFPC